MGDFEDEAATVPVEPPTTEVARNNVRAQTRPGWMAAPKTTISMARRQKRFYDAITASKIV
jgi:hypothetical protein